MNKNQIKLVNELTKLAEDLEQLLAKYNPAELFPEQISDKTYCDGKILNIELGVSFQSDASTEPLEKAITDFRIGGLRASKFLEEWDQGEFYDCKKNE